MGIYNHVPALIMFLKIPTSKRSHYCITVLLTVSYIIICPTTWPSDYKEDIENKYLTQMSRVLLYLNVNKYLYPFLYPAFRLIKEKNQSPGWEDSEVSFDGKQLFSFPICPSYTIVTHHATCTQPKRNPQKNLAMIYTTLQIGCMLSVR